jgi:hypothetical protein
MILGLEPIATYSATAADLPTPIAYRVTGIATEDWINIERIGAADFEWCVLWFRREDGQWRKVARIESLFATAEGALAAVTVALDDPLNAGPPAKSASAASGS